MFAKNVLKDTQLLPVFPAGNKEWSSYAPSVKCRGEKSFGKGSTFEKTATFCLIKKKKKKNLSSKMALLLVDAFFCSDEVRILSGR